MEKLYSGSIYMRTLTASAALDTEDYGKVYIGQTDNMAERDASWNKSNNNYGGKKITDARIKYGVLPGSWVTTELERVTANSEEELHALLDERETFNIYKYNSVENGFNGSYGNGMKGMKHTDESRAKISANHRHYQSEEAKQKISKTNMNHPVSDETKKKISEGNTGKVRTDEMKKAQSARLAGKEPKAASQGLKEYIIVNGHGPTKGIKQTAQARANMKAAQQANGTKTKAIYPDGSTKVFSTMLDAANACSMNVGSVDYLIKSGGKSRKNGMKFEPVHG